MMLLVCARKPFVKLQPPRLQEYLPHAFRWNAIVFHKTSSSLRRRKHLRTRRLRVAQSAGSAGPLSSLPRYSMCSRCSFGSLKVFGIKNWCYTWGKPVIKVGCCMMGTRRVHSQDRKSISEFSSYSTTLLPPSIRSLCSTTDSVLSYMKTSIEIQRW